MAADHVALKGYTVNRAWADARSSKGFRCIDCWKMRKPIASIPLTFSRP
jgi:hypothetical protein